MPELPSVSGRDLVRALGHEGFEVLRQRGSHVTLINRDKRTAVVVPVHSGKDLPPGTLSAILKGAGISIEELQALL